jgi:2-polyprenyl-3-methyl-5-hydroxy-6-metoxy-1,4-benzoquinol methylase
MAEDSGQSVMSSLESHIVPLVPELAPRLASGVRWLDLGCGRGMIIARLAELYPKSSFVGVDLSRDAISWAQGHASSKKLRNVEFVVKDLSDFDQKAERDAFDVVSTFDAVHDQAQPLRMLRGIHRTLKSDGLYLMQDIKGSSFVRNNIAHPLGTFLYTVSCMHCMTVSLAQGGEGLGAMWGEEKTREYLDQAGFASVQKNELAHDLQNNWYVARK